MTKINKVSNIVKDAIKRKSAYSLPDRPSEMGMKAEDIKRAFWQPVVDVTSSAISEIDRVVDEANQMNNDINISIEKANNEIAKKIDKSQIVQQEGQLDDCVMSQKVVTKKLSEKFDKTGGIITGNAQVNGRFDVDILNAYGNFSTNSIELGGELATPYIDWHYANSENDHDMRMILSSPSKLDIKGGAVNFEKMFQINNIDLYPIGSILMYTNNTAPASIFGGTWEKIVDRFLIGAGGKYAIGAKGGEEVHSLSIAEMPSHDHAGQMRMSGILCGIKSVDGSSSNTSVCGTVPENDSTITRVAAQGGNNAHNNMPPYLAVNIWKRIA